MNYTFERLIDKIFETSQVGHPERLPVQGGSKTVGTSSGGLNPHMEALLSRLTEKGYKVVDREISPELKELYAHDPANPTSTCKEAEEKINLAKLRLERGFFSLGSFLNYLNPVCNDPRIATAAVDQNGNLYYSSDFITKLTVGQVAALIMHEVAHIGMGDLFTGEGLDGKRFNIASDYVNNWYIINDLIAMNEGDANVIIGLPPGGCYPDEDGVVRTMNLTDTIAVELPEDDQIDLNLRGSQEVYEMLSKFDEDLLEAVNEQRFDIHIPKTSLTAAEIEIVPGGGGGGKSPPINVTGVEPADLNNVLIVDKQTGQPNIIIKTNLENKSATIIPLTPEEYNEMIKVYNIKGLPELNTMP